MSRQREYREYDDDFDEPSYRDRAPSNHRPPRRRNYYEDEYDDRRSYPPQRPVNRGREGGYPRREVPPDRGTYPPRRATERYGQSRPSDYRYDRDQSTPPRARPQRPRPVQQGTPPLQEAKRSTNRKIFLFIYNLFFYTLTIGILLSSLMFAFSEKSDAAIFGHRFYRVLTDSMAPQPDSPSKGFYSGDIVLVKMTDGSQVKEGDIVTFQVGDGDRYLTHRMVERLTELNGKEGDYIVTKGDANNSKDPPISADRVYGKVTFVIPKMGSVLNFVQENLWLCLVCILSTFGFFLVLKAYFLQPDTVRESTKRNRYPNGV
ncbi:signal peptidase I [Enterococcus pallens]|uniref:Signal peptidase I n=2 Tax=Enterococcus pallens TaxID=160454 RepID=R2SR30_9ENTE|nr:signal peptidase I [Enterococcus pallens]EOH97715.1 signal peptidase I [Enterococcus pallens ATCC BAA-351]EOU20866.1 signal peptidase I [Enterococcus pallens ATCC BAA-351]